MPPSLLWRRKTSTPWLPGAWPSSTSVSDHHDVPSNETAPDDDGPPQLPELLHIRPKRDSAGNDAETTWSFPTALEKHAFEDNLQPFVKVEREPALASPESDSAPLSASFSQDSSLTEPTDSEGVLTPDSLSRTPWLPFTPDRSNKYKDEFSPEAHVQVQDSFSSSISSRHDSTIDTISVDRTIPRPNVYPDTSLRSRLVTSANNDSPLLQLEPPLTLSTLSLNLTTIIYPSDVDTGEDADDPPASSSPPSLSQTTPGSFAVPSPGTEQGRTGIRAPVSMASTFFPVPSVHGSQKRESRARPDLTSSSSSSPSAYSLADSPVLPCEGSADPVAPFDVTGLALSPTSEDLDAFARAAAAAASVTDSSISLPSVLDSVPEPEERPPAPPYTREYTAESGVPSLALAVAACTSTRSSLGTDDQHHNEGDHYEYDGRNSVLEEEHEYQIKEAVRIRRRSEPVLQSPQTPAGVRSPSLKRTISSRVEVEPVEPLQAGVGAGTARERPVKLLMLGRVRKLGGKILGLLTGSKSGGGKGALGEAKKGGEPGPGLRGVKRTTTTAVTKVEYAPDHPVVSPETPRRTARASRRSLALPIPISLSPSHPPRTPQRDSFLPIGNDPAARPILSRPFHHRRNRSSSASAEPAQINVEDEHASRISAPRRRVARSRTQTAPPASVHTHGHTHTDGHTQARSQVHFAASEQPARKQRRFSLSSALSKSRLDALKTTVAPHPPVPTFPRSSTSDPRAGRPSVEKPVRPMSMIVGNGLDARQGEESVTSGAGPGDSKAKGKRPVSMVLNIGARDDDPGSGQSLSHHPLPGEQADKRPVRPTSLLVGKDKEARHSWVEVGGSRFKLYQSPKEEQCEENSAPRPVDMAVVPEAGEQPVLANRTPSPRTCEEEQPVVPKSPGREIEPSVMTDTQTEGSSRRFSFSSAISKRAMRARSMIVSVSRHNSDPESTAGPSTPSTPPKQGRRGRGNTFSTIVDAGIRFDMLTPGFGFGFTPPRPPVRPEPSSPASRRSNDLDFRRDRDPERPVHAFDEEYACAPDSELDSMSFAHTATLRENGGSIYDGDFDLASSRPVSITDTRPVTEGASAAEAELALDEPFQESAPVAKRLALSQSYSVGLEPSAASEEDEQVVAEREEERGFMRALGLE